MQSDLNSPKNLKEIVKMPTITDMRMRRGRPERFIVTVDEEMEFVLTPEIVLQYGIAPQREFSEEEFQRLLEEDALRQAKDQAMRYLANRPHSRKELFQKMYRKGYRKAVIDQALDQLEKLDLVNDQAFARLFIQDQIKRGGVSRSLLRHKLLEKGIARELIQQLLDELLPPEKEQELAREAAEKYQRTHPNLSGKALREKQVQHLQRLGFPWEQIRMVVSWNNPSDER